MSLEKTIKFAYLLPSGQITAFGKDDKSIDYIFGYYSIDKHKRIMLEAEDNIELTGFDSLPKGFTKTALEFAHEYRKQDLSWEEIQNLKTEQQ